MGAASPPTPEIGHSRKTVLAGLRLSRGFSIRYIRTCYSEGFLLLEIFYVSENDLLQFVQTYQQPVYVSLNTK